MKQVVTVGLGEIILNNHEGFLGLISELATGTDLLMDISYQVVGLGREPNTLLIEVSGDDSQVKEALGDN